MENKVRYKEGPIAVTDPETIRIAVTPNPQGQAASAQEGDHLGHALRHRLGSAATKVGVACTVEHRAAHAPLFQEPVEKAARCTPQEMDRDGHARAADAVQVNAPFEGLQVGGTDLFINPEPQPAGLSHAEVVNATVR